MLEDQYLNGEQKTICAFFGELMLFSMTVVYTDTNGSFVPSFKDENIIHRHPVRSF